MRLIRAPLKPTDLNLPATVKAIACLRLLLVLLVLIVQQLWPAATTSEMDDPRLLEPIHIALTLVAGWSLAVLLIPWLQRHLKPDLRELLIDTGWIFLAAASAGGASNPFIYYYLVTVALASLLLSKKLAASICTLSIVFYTLLLWRGVSDHFQHLSSDYQTHLMGMWVNYVLSASLICLSITSLVSTLKRQQQEIGRIRETNLKNEQIIGMATLSATTVHELATPLSTLTLMTNELEQNPHLSVQDKEDLDIMKEQIRRCRTAIHNLSQVAVNQELDVVDQTSATLMEELKDHYALQLPDHKLEFDNQAPPNLMFSSSTLLRYAIINLINNALESSDDQVHVGFQKSAEYLLINIRNSTSLSQEQLIERWGKPHASEKNLGLGIGSFLANSTIEKLGGSVSMTATDVDTEFHTMTVLVNIALPATHQPYFDQQAYENSVS